MKRLITRTLLGAAVISGCDELTHVSAWWAVTLAFTAGALLYLLTADMAHS